MKPIGRPDGMQSLPHKQCWTRRQTLAAMGGLAVAGCTAREVQIRLGVVDWVGYAPLYIARDRQLFGDLKLEIRTFTGTNQAKLAFVGQKLDAAGEITSGAADLRAAGKDFKVILVADRSVGADGILARNSVRDLADLRGRKVAVEVGSVSHFFFLQAIAGVGLSPRDVTIINTEPAAAAAAYQSGQAEVAVTYAPYLGAAERAIPDGRILFDSARLPYAVSDIYVFDTEFVEKNPEAIQTFVDGIFAGLDYLVRNPDAGYAIVAKQLKIFPEDVKNYLRGVRLVDRATNLEMLTDTRSPGYLLAAIESLALFLKEQGQIAHLPDLRRVIEPRFVLAARNSSNP